MAKKCTMLSFQQFAYLAVLTSSAHTSWRNKTVNTSPFNTNWRVAVDLIELLFGFRVVCRVYVYACSVFGSLIEILIKHLRWWIWCARSGTFIQFDTFGDLYGCVCVQFQCILHMLCFRYCFSLSSRRHRAHSRLKHVNLRTTHPNNPWYLLFCLLSSAFLPS